MKKVALVTGGSRGIGLSISQKLLNEGYLLMICGVRAEESVRSVIHSLNTESQRVFYFQADVSQKKDREALIEAVQKQFGQLNVLINNAGMAPLDRVDLLQASEESFEKVLKVNLQGPYFLTQMTARWMIQQKENNGNWKGCIVNISSISAEVVSVNRGEYCVSKAGLSMSTKLWAARLGEYGIPVYEVRPGIVQTDMTKNVKEKYDKYIADGRFVESRWGTVEDVSKAVSMLVRGDVSYSTGQVLNVDGGVTLQQL